MIKKLSEEKIKQIAAGEIITNPASAIKEILDNAIDAKAKKITIYIHDNGLEKLIIKDDGIGMSKADLKICTQMHTTSKTEENDELFGQNSLGFRGEALASIEAISNLKIETNSLKFENGIISHSKLEKGTQIEISNMFEKLPARLKFLRKSNVEYENIKNIIKKYIINFNHINFEIYNNDKKLWHFEKSSKKERINIFFKEEPLDFSSEINHEKFGLIKISGYLFKKHQNYNCIFVNNKCIKDKAIFAYIKSIFKEHFMKHENPSYILFIEIEPILIDCNVHPAKTEIKFISYKEIFSMLSNIFNSSFFNQIYSNPFLDTSNLEDAYLEKLEDFKPQELTKPKQNINFKEPSYQTPLIKTFENIDFANEPMIFRSQDLTSINYTIIGQFNDSYILFETESKLGVFDQHAAHERKLYEQMKTELNKDSKQQLLMPIPLTLNAKQSEYINENIKIFANKGIIIEQNILTHIPNLLNKTDFKEFLENEMQENAASEILIDRLFANIACKKALKAKTKLSIDQMDTLLRDALKNPPVCNHGRPVFKYFSFNEIGTWFKR